MAKKIKEFKEPKEDLLDVKILREQEKLAIPFEEYLKARPHRIKHRKEVYK